MRCVTAIGALVLFCVADGLAAQEPKAKPTGEQATQDKQTKDTTARGKIARIRTDDAGRAHIVVTTGDGEELTFNVDENTIFRVNDRDARLSSFREGSEISVSYITRGERLLARSVNNVIGAPAKGFSPGAQAKDLVPVPEPQDAEAMTVTGKIVKTQPDLALMTIRTVGGKDLSLVIPERLKFAMKNGSSKLSDLSEGTPVKATYVLKDGRNVVTSLLDSGETAETATAAAGAAGAGRADNTMRFQGEVSIVTHENGTVVITITNAQGAQTGGAAAGTAFSGRVTRVQDGMVTIQAADGQEQVFFTDPRTRFFTNGSVAQITDFPVGSRVSGFFTTQDGRNVASVFGTGTLPRLDSRSPIPHPPQPTPGSGFTNPPGFRGGNPPATTTPPANPGRVAPTTPNQPLPTQPQPTPPATNPTRPAQPPGAKPTQPVLPPGGAKPPASNPTPTPPGA